jgi:hypothetical protein
MDRQALIALLPVLLPLAASWARSREKRALQNGVALTALELQDAAAIGVVHPGRVRLLSVKTILRPAQPQLRAACDAIDFLTADTRGLTLGYGIFIRADCWRERDLVAHELAHVAQYEQLGGIAPFLHEYLTQCLTVGYDDAPLEQEARIAVGRLEPVRDRRDLA